MLISLVLNTERTLKETEQISHTTHTNSVLHKLKGFRLQDFRHRVTGINCMCLGHVTQRIVVKDILVQEGLHNSMRLKLLPDVTHYVPLLWIWDSRVHSETISDNWMNCIQQNHECMIMPYTIFFLCSSSASRFLNKIENTYFIYIISKILFYEYNFSFKLATFN